LGDYGPANSSTIWGPTGVGSDNFGNLFIAEGNRQKIRIVPSQGSLMITVQGTGNTHICYGTAVSFKAFTSVSGNVSFQWYKNTTAVSGATGSTFTSTNIDNNDAISWVRLQ
jgi:hypothetical protein